MSITHQEIGRAIELNKPRWVLTHSDVVFARRLLRDLGYGKPEKRRALKLNKGAKALTDLRVIDLYEEVIQDGNPLAERAGNWVQGFRGDVDALLFATAQFSRFQEVEAFIQENLKRREEVLAEVDRQRGGKP